MQSYTIYEVQEETRLRRWAHHVEAPSEEEALDKVHAGETEAIDLGYSGEETYSGSGFAVTAGDSRGDHAAWERAIANMREKL